MKLQQDKHGDLKIFFSQFFVCVVGICIAKSYDLGKPKAIVYVQYNDLQNQFFCS
jgi:hypothetical protein